MKRCCFWNDLSYPAAAGAMYTIGLSLFYIAVWIAVWTNGVYPSNALVSPSSYPIINTMIVPVVLDAVEIFTAAIALYGIAKGRRRCILGWLVYLPIYIVYQIALLVILVFVLASFSDNQKGLLIPVVIFWCIQLIINVSSEFVTWSYYKQMTKQASAKSSYSRSLPPQGFPSYSYPKTYTTNYPSPYTTSYPSPYAYNGPY